MAYNGPQPAKKPVVKAYDIVMSQNSRFFKSAQTPSLIGVLSTDAEAEGS